MAGALQRARESRSRHASPPILGTFGWVECERFRTAPEPPHYPVLKVVIYGRILSSFRPPDFACALSVADVGPRVKERVLGRQHRRQPVPRPRVPAPLRRRSHRIHIGQKKL
jgi:hypothetical protein